MVSLGAASVWRGSARWGMVANGHPFFGETVMIVYRARFELLGSMPLLMHRDDIEGSDELKAWRQSPENKNVSVPGDDRSPGWTWQTYLYNDGVNVTIPQENVMGALLYGGAQLILKKSKTYKELSQSAIFMATEHLEFTFDGGKQLAMADVVAMKNMPFAKQAEECKRLGFRLFAKRAKIGQAKHVRVRPRFESWSVRGELEVTSPDLPFEKLREILGFAGRAGLCDWRPSSKRPGPYGMFTSNISLI